MDIVDRLREGVYDGDYEGLNTLLDDAIAEIAALRNEVERLRKLDTEAAQVEKVICMHSRHFTGEAPYIGWPGLALALSQDYIDLENFRRYYEN